MDGQVKQVQDFHAGAHCRCPVWKMKYNCELFWLTNIVKLYQLRYITNHNGFLNLTK